MPTDPFYFAAIIAVITFLLTILGTRLVDYMRGKDTVASLQRDNKSLADDNSQLQARLKELETKESQRVSEEADRRKHGRDNKQVEILRMLNTQKGRYVNHIARDLGIGPELVLKHLVDLSYDNFVHSPNYNEDPDWDDGCEPYHSVWYIQQGGRTYLADNGLLT